MQRKLNFLFIIVLSFVMSSALSAQTILNETFNYTVGDSLAAHGWVGHSWSGTNNTILIQSGSLTYNGFVNSGAGKSVILSATGEDLHKTFTDSVATGAVYASFLVNVSAAQATGDYFFHFINSNLAQNLYRGRVFVKLNGDNTISFGINKGSTAGTLAYGTTTFALNTVHLLVVKYAFNASTGDDIVSLFVDPTLSATEPTPLVSVTDAAQTDLLSIANIAIRQGSATAGPTLALSGIHVAKAWDLGGTVTPTLALTSPVGAENWIQASSHNITWTSTNVANVKLELSTDGGSSYTDIIASTPAAAGSYAWTVPAVATTNAKIRISDVASVATPATSAAFTIAAVATPTLVLTSPVGAESWTVATSHNITWTSTLVTNVKLEVSTDGGTTFSTIIASTPAAAGSYAWTVPNTPATTVKVKISDVDAVASASTSAAFTIAATSTQLTIAQVRALPAGTSPTVGSKATVTGIVNSPNFSTSVNAFYIQDGTAGINIFGGALTSVALGDSIVATGWLMAYNGSLELTDSVKTTFPLVITVVKTGNPAPTPKVITVAELNSNGENYESTLITIKNVSKTSGTWPTTAKTATIVCAANGNTTDALALVVKNPSELILTAEPAWPKDVTGIATQYTTTGSGGYQIQPRYVSDFAVITDVKNETNNSNTVIKGFGLSQNYPNPFNPTTNISYNLDKPGVVTLKVYNVLGNEVASLVNEYKSAGNYNINFNAASLTSGVYLYKLQVGAQSVTKKLTLMK